MLALHSFYDQLLQKPSGYTIAIIVLPLVAIMRDYIRSFTVLS